MRMMTLTSPVPLRRISSYYLISLSGRTECKKFDDFSVEREAFTLFGFYNLPSSKPSNN